MAKTTVRKTGAQVPHSLVLVLPWLASECSAKPLHLCDSHLVPPTKGLRHHGQEDDPLPLAGLSGLLHLAFEGVIQSVSCSCSSFFNYNKTRGENQSTVQECSSGPQCNLVKRAGSSNSTWFFPLEPCQSFHISSQKMWRWNVLSERINCWKTFLFRNSHCSRKNCVSYVEYFLGKSAWGGRGSLGLVRPRGSQDFGGWLGNTCVFHPPAHRPKESSFGWDSCWTREGSENFLVSQL